MPGTKRLGALLALLAAVAALSGCGSDEISGEIPPENALNLNTALNGVRGAIAVGNCDGASSSADQFVAEVNDLPADAGEELKAELREAGDNLEILVSEECVSTEPTETTPTDTTPTDTTPTDTTPTDTTPTDTTPTDTTPTDTTPTDTTEEPPPQGDGDGGGPPGDGGGTDGGTGGTGSGSGDETDE